MHLPVDGGRKSFGIRCRPTIQGPIRSSSFNPHPPNELFNNQSEAFESSLARRLPFSPGQICLCGNLPFSDCQWLVDEIKMANYPCSSLLSVPIRTQMRISLKAESLRPAFRARRETKAERHTHILSPDGSRKKRRDANENVHDLPRNSDNMLKSWSEDRVISSTEPIE
jgi:hypothetical protein